MIPENEWMKAVAALERAGSVAVCSHISPDGDALGSMAGLGGYLSRAGKKVWMSWGSAELKVPPQYEFLPGLENVVPWDQVPGDLDVFVAIDCGDLSRLELLNEKFASAKLKLNIDHHLSNPMFADTNLVDVSAASSSEIAYELVKRLGGTPNRAEATCFYTGIVTDTGRFQYSNSSPKTLRDAAELRELGVDHQLVAERIFESAPFLVLRVMGTVLSRAKLEDGLVWSWMEPADLGEVPVEETEDFIDALKVVREAQVAALLKQKKPGEWRVSLRSRGEIDVSEVAQLFDGGGHARAAGYFRKGTLEEVATTLQKAIAEHAGRGAGGQEPPSDQKTQPAAAAHDDD